MKSSSMIRQSLPISLLLVTLAFLPGCMPFDWIKKQFSTDKSMPQSTQEAGNAGSSTKPAGNKEELGTEVLISMDGKPVVTMAHLEEDYKQVLEERPELKSFEPYVKANLLQGLVTQAIVDRYVTEHNIQDTDAYKKDRENMVDRLTRVLNVKYFRDAHPVDIKEADVKEYYEKNKDSFPDLIIERGGVETMAVSFEKEAEAKAFLAKAKADQKDFEKLAQAANKNTFRDFKLVNAQSPEVDPSIKNAVVDIKKFPHIQMVKAPNNTFWVVNTTTRKESKFRPFDGQVKEGLRQYMVQEKQMKVMEDEMAQLKDKYKIVVNATALNPAPTQVDFEQSLGMVDNSVQTAELEEAQDAVVARAAKVA